ncbi:MAG: Mrp/NBP35 family ATP-binding protein [Desulfobulbaceae bacterium]|nr:Mrp/NBP35 family ATP-binding protein [Desulfobulbaceae bacterium]HIJ78740.1 Mrp/NBP35 family ATP-binding protein [Deltaproteobacteria bacterium]
MSKCSSSGCGSKGGSCGSADANATIAQQNMAINASLGRIKNKILVMSGKGGVGKSTVSVNLAIGLAKKGHKVGLMDVDLHGPDIVRMLGMDGPLNGKHSKEGKMPPLQYNDNLRVISLESMMENRDDPVIWRGPLKNQAIRQFIADVDWGDLDYLIIDAPPGTGDEPMTVANTIKDANALVVTTPQSIALADVRKSLNFCKIVKMRIIGVVENMSGFICPHCDKPVDIFKTGGGEKLANEFSVPFLGRIPVDPKVVIAGDDGTPYLSSGAKGLAVEAFEAFLAKVMKEQPVKAAAIPMAGLNSSCGCGSGPCNPDTCDC